METNAESILWTAGFFNERFSEPVSPLGWSLIGPLVEELALREPLRYLGYPQAGKLPITRLWRGHPYTNVAVFQILYKLFPDWLLPEDAYRYFPEGNVELRKAAGYPGSILSPQMLASVARAFLSDPLDFSPWHNYRKWDRYVSVHDRRVQEMRARIQMLKNAKASPQTILDALREVISIHRGLLRIHRWSLTHADLTFGLMKRLIRAWADREHAGEIAAEWIANVPNKTREVDAALNRLAKWFCGSPRLQEAAQKATTFSEFMALLEQEEAIRSDTDREFLDGLQAFLAEHGHRSFSLDIAAPTFAEDPMQVISLLQGIGGGDGATKSHAHNQVAPVGAIKQKVLDIVHALAIKYVALREDQRYYWQKSLALSRLLYLLLADHLLAEGSIQRREDVFYATHADLEEYYAGTLSRETLATRIGHRRIEWEGFWREFQQSPASAYPTFLEGDKPLALTPPSQEVWYARAVSPGTARGLVRVCKSAGDLVRVRQGEILVAPSTDPAWTPVFGRIAGLVLERGGVLSHGAVVAREYGVPAVAGATSIADLVHDGDMIEVDGSAGRIARIAP